MVSSLKKTHQMCWLYLGPCPARQETLVSGYAKLVARRATVYVVSTGESVLLRDGCVYTTRRIL